MNRPHWTVYPAIDLRRGRVVRLRQGEPTQETVYADDPVAVARRWQEAGATWVHVVNLDGAFGVCSQENMRALRGILRMGLRVQFGGGVRDRSALEALLGWGVDRVLLGTMAVQEPEVLAEAVRACGPERVGVSIDAREGWVRIRGWREEAGCTALELAQRCVAQGVRWVVYTDIARDGTCTGLHVAAAAELARQTGLWVIAAGGVLDLRDVRRAWRAGLAGVVIGRALYAGTIDLREALGIGGVSDAGQAHHPLPGRQGRPGGQGDPLS